MMLTVAATAPREEFGGMLTLLEHVKETSIILEPYNINADNFYESMTMESGLLESIFTAMSEFTPEKIILQLDRALPHTGHRTEKLKEYVLNNNLNMKVLFQPANSPDLNVNDLALLRSLQVRSESLRHDYDTGEMESIVRSIEAAFDSYDENTLKAAFAHLFSIYNHVLQTLGDNDFGNAHSHSRSKLKKETDVNIVDITSDRYCELLELVNEYFYL